MPEITSVIPDADPNRKQLHLRRIGLKVVSGPDEGKSAEFDHDVIRIGASEGNHFLLTDATVSRRHAEITRTQEGLVLRDLGSTNGTYLGQVRIKEVYLGENRSFRVGKTDLEFALLDEVIDIVPTRETRFENIVGQSVAMRECFAVLDRVARTELTVMVTGETGSGKELVSRAIHMRSQRKSGPFVVFDCGAVARNLIESELFGHERGAFTGATAQKPGLVEAAAGGTLFIDEVGDIPLGAQVKLLRLLETGTFRRVGSTELRHADIRVVSATHRDLPAMIASGQFRADLYYRISTFPIRLPPLRERVGDVPLLIDALLTRLAPGKRVRAEADALARLAAHEFPGNVRELRNLLERALLLGDGRALRLADVQSALALDSAPPAAEVATAHSQGRAAEARAQGISVRTLYRRLAAGRLSRVPG